MTSCFGHKFTGGYGEDIDPDGVWLAVLCDITEEQVEAGLKRLGDSGAVWPPSPPEFKKLCLNKQGNWAHNSAAYKVFDKSKAIEKLASSKEHASKKLDEIKSMLKG